MKRAMTVFCVALLLMMSVLGLAAEANLLYNGGFETITSAGMPEDWYATAYRSQAGYSRMVVTDEKAHSGNYSALVENASSNDARFTCTVRVKPESLYRLSGYVLVESMEDTGNGANFGVEGIYSFSDGLFDTNGEWQYLEWYGETGEDQTEVTIGIRVGGYSAESTGKAYFDDIKLEKVDVLPEKVVASLWYNASAGSSFSQTDDADIPQKSTLLFVCIGAAFLLLTFFLAYKLDQNNHHNSAMIVFALLLLVSLILRVFLGMRVEGYEVDINCFKAWSLRIASVGPADFYAPDYFCDYPPGAMLLLWPIGKLLHTVGLDHAAALLIVKLLPILCDIAGAICLWYYTFKKRGLYPAVVLSALYLLNPAVLVNGAAWGQMDSVLSLFLLLTTVAAMHQKWRYAIPLFVISLLVKPQALLFAPVGGMALLFHLFQCGKQERKKLLFSQIIPGICLSFCAALVIAGPFAVKQPNPFTWLFELYGGTLGSYAYATLNTANLYYLFGANWASLTQGVPAVLLVLSVSAFAGCALILVWGKKSKKIHISTKKCNVLTVLCAVMAVAQLFMLFAHAHYQEYGYLMMVFVYVFAISCFAFEKKKSGSLPYFMALALIGVYVLGIKVHERYLFPAFLLLLLAYTYTHDRRILGIFAGFSATTFINTAIVLDNSILFGSAQGHLNADTLVLNDLLCVVNLLLCAYAAWIGVSGLRASVGIKSAAAESEGKNAPNRYAKLLFAPGDHRLHFTTRDFLLMGVTTLIYAALAFSHLGSTTAPQTAWVSTSKDESVVFELDETSRFSLLYYAGVSYNDFSVSVSEDGVNWSEEYPCEMREGLCYRWNYVLNATTANGQTTYPSLNPSNVRWMEGKFLRINACNAGLNLWEIILRDENGNNLGLELIDHVNAQPMLLEESRPAAHLIDEQNTCDGEPGWYTGTYFDEIYHARTAYEHLHGQAPYETTHPPLGKLLMSIGIAIFGMTPFGWRFAGALIGVLMLPAIYLLAMQITHKQSVACVSMLALTFDLMHFTQTRIATIDSFPVFFIMLTYLFMIRYMQMDPFAASDPRVPKLMDKAYLKTLIPLLLCGICMGLSIASKWIGIYSAIGLAVLFFLTMYRNARACDAAWEDAEGEASRIIVAREFTIHRIFITCAFCLLFFIVIPCLIYGLSYIPYLSPTGPVTIKRIIRAQEGMLSYHSTPGLGMDHPFQSPWWQWPFILKPMWFAQDQFEPAGYASTIMCMGNPWIFYIGAVAMAAVLLVWLCKRIRYKNGTITLRIEESDPTFSILSIGFLAQYLPWVLVPRSMYMYHYFASVPFIIMATAVLMEKTAFRKPKLSKLLIAVYLTGSLVFFIMFFPYASGYLTNTEWLDAMKWFSKLYY